jgi:two-component system sensor histidine kinase QseC
LLNNLLSNSIRHNYKGGNIFIKTANNSLIIRNSGIGKELDKPRVFRRFYKSDQSNDSTGLGLAIIKQICEVSDCEINYSYVNGEHVFSLQWNKIDGDPTEVYC